MHENGRTPDYGRRLQDSLTDPFHNGILESDFLARQREVLGGQFPNEYVSISGDEIIAHSQDLGQVFTEMDVRSIPDGNAVVFYVGQQDGSTRQEGK